MAGMVTWAEAISPASRASGSSIILAHNHPSGVPTESAADLAITARLKQALALVDIRVLDHIVVGETCVSLAARGWV